MLCGGITSRSYKIADVAASHWLDFYLVCDNCTSKESYNPLIRVNKVDYKIPCIIVHNCRQSIQFCNCSVVPRHRSHFHVTDHISTSSQCSRILISFFDFMEISLNFPIAKSCVFEFKKHFSRMAVSNL